MSIKKIEKILNELYNPRTFHISHKSTKKPINNIIDLKNFLYGYYHIGYRQKVLDEFLNKKDTRGFFDENFLRRLQNANLCCGYYDPNWKIISFKNDKEIFVKKNKITLLSQKNDLNIKGSLKIGKNVSLKFPKDRIIISSGFYHIVSNNGYPNVSKPITKIYFNTNIHTIEKFLQRLTKQLSIKNITFQFKTLLNPAHYKRRDSSVLYINKEYYQKCFSVISNISKQNRHFFLPGIPFFAKNIFSGIAIAEELQNNSKESFGQHRFNLIACVKSSSVEKLIERSWGVLAA